MSCASLQVEEKIPPKQAKQDKVLNSCSTKRTENKGDKTLSAILDSSTQAKLFLSPCPMAIPPISLLPAGGEAKLLLFICPTAIPPHFSAAR